MSRFWKIVLVSLCIVVSCSKQEGIIRHTHLLELTPVTGTSTKTLVDGNNISEKLLGMQICNSAGSALYSNNSDYNNLRLSNNGSRWLVDDGSGVEEEIELTTQEAKIYAYYPYNQTSGELTGTGENLTLKISIPSEMTQNQMTDYMWSSQGTTLPEGGSAISATNNSVQLKINHAMVLVAFVIYKDGYDGYGVLQRVQFRDKSVSPGLRVNKTVNNDLSMLVKDGTITGGTLTDKMILNDLSDTIKLTSDPGTDPATLFLSKNAYFLMAPASFSLKSNIELMFRINGVDFISTISGSDPIDFETGSMYVFKVKLFVNQAMITSVTQWDGENWEAVTGTSSLISINGWDNESGSSTGGYDPWGGLSPVTIEHGGSIGTLMWAPRNAGYDKNHKYGLLYQWHRRCGQTYDESPAVSLVSGGGTLSQGSDILYRNTFFLQYTANNDWCTTSETSWSNSSPYNPCPPGWRVPTGAEISALKDSGSTWVNSNSGGIDNLPGRWYAGNHSGDHTGSVFLPAAGRRSPIGTTGFRDNYGHYWTASASGTSGVDFFLNSDASSTDASYRAYAFSIRCVKSVE
ncbi:MAG: fimbrillin family protein [Bacteroidales bacterium]